MVARRNVPRGGADRCRRSHESEGVLDDCRLKRCWRCRRDSSVSSSKTWMTFEDSYVGIDLPREKPSRDQKFWEWLLAVPATNIRKLLSYATRSDLWPGLPSEMLTCEKCGVKVRGERGPKIHLQQWCGQMAHDAETASRLEAKEWPCSYCQKFFSTGSNRIAHERTSSPRFLERRRDSRLTSSFWNLMAQTALRLRPSSASCKTQPLTEARRSLVRPSDFVGCRRCLPPR